MFSKSRLAFFVTVIGGASVATNVCAQEAAGKTIMVRGDVVASTDTSSRKLRRRSPVFDVDVIETGAASNTQLRMVDGGLLSLKADSALNIANYEYNPDTGQGDVSMKLVKGGLRSITGALNKAGTNYRLDTPVASIGVRGTHFEIELINGDMFLAVWDGAIDVTVQTNGQDNIVSFGEGEDFSFGLIDESGEVTELLEAPDNFDQGHSEDNTEDDDSGDGDEDSNDGDDDSGDSDSQESSDDGSEESADSGESEGESGEQDSQEGEGGSDDEGDSSGDSSDSSTESGGDDGGAGDEGDLGDGDLGGGDLAGSDSTPPGETGGDTSTTGTDGADISSDEFVDNDIVNDDLVGDPDDVVIRTGVATFSQLEQQTITSTAGTVRNVEASITVDFDTARIPEGSISFEDDGGEWFAAFNGVIASSDTLDLSVNFAAHGDNLATGDITGLLIDDATGILGNVNLNEVANPSINAGGSFLLREQ